MTLALQKLVSSLDADEECAEILLQAWYLDNGALAGTRSAVLRALHLIEELGPALGLHVNLAKCEMFSRRGNTSFPLEATPKPKMLARIYGCLNMSLVRSVARAIMGRVNVRIGRISSPAWRTKEKQQGIQRVTLLHSRADLVK
eukprot:Em0004g185a